MSEHDEIVQEFVVESVEALDRLDTEMMALESDPGDRDTLQSIFRKIHSIKGACGFLEFKRLESVTHAGENVLDALRDGSLRLDDNLATVLLEMNDAVRSLLGVIETTGSDDAGPDYSGLIEQLRDVLGRCDGEVTGSVATDARVAADDERGDDAEPAPGAATEPTSASHTTGAAASSIRLRVAQLDALMNLAGELVLARNQILQHATRIDDSATQATAQRLSRITTELQEGIMKIRMQPIGTLWNKLPRVVRDLSHQLGKSVRLELDGSETEVDKTLLEAIKDPLTHLLRNALDHGVESPEERTACGKPAESALRISAFHESGQVNIVVSDDGRGIDPHLVRTRAVECGIVSEAEASQLDEREVIELLFTPGFSTARQVTNVSGRGVGMDVVRNNLELVGGSVEIESTPGVGTDVMVRIPLTLAIIPALIVHSAGNRYAIPQANLVELLSVQSSSGDRIENVFGQRVYRLRGDLLPLVDLAGELGTDPEDENDERIIVVVQAGGRTFGLIVDGIHESEEIVVKPLDRVVKALDVYAGTTILADGRVALILDIAGLAQRARLMSPDDPEAATHVADRAGSTASDELSTESQELLVFHVGVGRRLAMDLAEVDRLEEIDPGTVETAGETRFVQYREHLVQLIDVGQALGEAPCATDDRARWKTIVRKRGALRYGLVVDDVDDILSQASRRDTRPSRHEAIAAVTTVDGQVTEIMDEEWLLASLDGLEITESRKTEAAGQDGADAASTEGETTIQLCTFRLGSSLYGIDVLDVQEVLRPQQRTPIPLSPHSVEGLLNLRGDTVLSVDLRRLMSESPPNAEGEDGREPMNVVVRTSQGSMSVLVDEIGEVAEIPCAAFETCPPSVPAAQRKAVRGVFKMSNELLLQLDAESLATMVASAEAADAAHDAEANVTVTA